MPQLSPTVPLVLASALMLCGCTPRAEQVPAQIASAADSVRELDGVVDVEVSRSTAAEPTPRNFGQRQAPPLSRVDARIQLDDVLTPAAAGAAAHKTQQLLSTAADRTEPHENISLSTELVISSQDGGGDDPWLTVRSDATTSPESVADAAEDGYELHVAGAATTWLALSKPSGADPDAADPPSETAYVAATAPDTLVDLARTAVELDRPVELEAPGARYQAAWRVPDVEAVRLVAGAAARPGVQDVAYLTQQHRITLRSDAEPGDQDLADLRRWLDTRDIPDADDPLAYTVMDASSAETTGWVSDRRPTSHEPHALDPFGGATPWPDDPTAPDCTADDLTVAFGVVDSAAGTRGSSVSARNVSGRPCAVENVPVLTFRNEAGKAQEDVTIAPYEPGAEPGRVVLPHDASVLSMLLWRTMSTANDPDTTVTIEVTAVPGGRPVDLDVTADGTSASGLDVLDGAEVRVSPWIQGEIQGD